MKQSLFSLVSFVFTLLACSQTAQKPSDAADKLTIHASSSEEYAFSNITLDSTTLEKYIDENKLPAATAEQMRTFYADRDYQYGWFDEDGIAEHTKAFWNLHRNFVELSGDSSLHDKWLHQQMETLIEDDDASELNPQTIQQTELALTDHFFRYVHYVYTGKVNPRSVNWYIPRKKVDAVSLLDSLTHTNGKNLDKWEPVNKQYQKLKKELLRYYDIEKSGGWTVIDLGAHKVVRRGDSAQAVVPIKQRLQATGDLNESDQSAVFDDQLDKAVKHFQRRHGLVADGIVGPATLRKLNIPVEDLMQKIMINMERMRWLPEQPADKYILVNIPEFRLHAYENNKPAFDMKVVVGKQGTTTQVFSGNLKYIVFSPYWNVPRSIIRKEILPEMNKNSYYLESKNMEIVKYVNGLPVIRQKPGPNNSLGQVKFLFPNSYNIYLHDTPARSLFDENKRAFSHGCIRVEEPERLAQWLLRNRSEWTDDAIWEAMNQDKEKWVTLQETVPVFITYFTAWVDKDGTLQFRDDIYGHDQRMAAKLFSHIVHR